MLPAFELRKVAEADFPSRFGHFRIYGFEGRADGIVEESVVLKMGDISGDPPLVRVHSQCFTGDVFHSLRCDCRAQLELALETIANEGRGLLIYEHQEGRGIGLMNKLRMREPTKSTSLSQIRAVPPQGPDGSYFSGLTEIR
jgi:GTP cyclohydrolase II